MMQNNSPYRVVIADDHQLVIDGLRALINDNKDFQIVGTCTNGKDVIEFLSNNDCDLLLLDIQMPVLDGLETARQLQEIKPSIPILMLTMHDEKEFIEKALEYGAKGYLLKDTTEEILTEALNRLVQGQFYFGGNVVLKLTDSGYTGSQTKTRHVELSSRELDIIALICEEYTTEEIAEKLFLSTNTIKTHRKRILQKLDVRNIAGIVRYAVEHNLV